MDRPEIWPDEACSALLAATDRGDALSVVALVRRHGVIGPIQLLGDALQVALAERPRDAGPLAAEVASLLDARGWDGDGVLVHCLRAASGSIAFPELRPAPVDLPGLAALIDTDPEMGEISVDLKTGSAQMVGWQGPARVVLEQEDRLWLTPGSLGGWGDTVRFARVLPEGPLREAIVEALGAEHEALPRFHAIIQADEALERAWTAFRRERSLARARSWLAREGVRVCPPGAR